MTTGDAAMAGKQHFFTPWTPHIIRVVEHKRALWRSNVLEISCGIAQSNKGTAPCVHAPLWL